MKADVVLPLDVVLASGSLRQVHVAGSEHDVKTELPRENARDVAVPGARHADVGLGEKRRSASLR